MKKYFYFNLEEREVLLNKYEGKCVDDPQTSQKKFGGVLVCEEDEIVVDGEIVKHAEYLEKVKETKLEDLKTVNKEKIYERYTDIKQFNILAGIGNYGSFEEMKIYIEDKLRRYNRVKSLIENATTIEELKEIDIETEYNKEN